MNARKELSATGKVTEELKAWLQALTEEAPNSETKEEAVDFLEVLPDIERINYLKSLTEESHQEEIMKQFQDGVLRIPDYMKSSEERTMQETPNSGGTSSSKDHAQVKSIRIKAAKHETQEEEIDIEKVGLSVMLAMSICVAVQWLFGNCQKRKKKAEQPVRIKMMRKKRDEDSEDFELVPNQKDEEEPSVKKESDKEKEQKSEVS